MTVLLERDHRFCIVTTDSGRGQNVVTLQQNAWSPSVRTAGHVQSELVVTIARNTQLLLYATISNVAVAVGIKLNVPADGAIGAGLLLAILGNTLGKTRRNAVIGVRTPWTLGSDEVWSRTNRFAGRLLILGGAVTIVGALVGYGIVVLLSVVVATAAVATVHSYLAAKHLRGDT